MVVKVFVSERPRHYDFGYFRSIDFESGDHIDRPLSLSRSLLAIKVTSMVALSLVS